MEKGWKEVYMTGHDYKAAMAKDMLENEGITAVMLNQHDTTFPSSGDFSVHVAEADEAKAIEILKKLKH